MFDPSITKTFPDPGLATVTTNVVSKFKALASWFTFIISVATVFTLEIFVAVVLISVHY